MSTKVGDLFVELGIRGSEKTISAFTNVKQEMGGLASMSLEVKAAIVGALYALEQLVAHSNALGTNLATTSTVLGVSAKTLQQYGYAALQVGSNLEEVEGSFKS